MGFDDDSLRELLARLPPEQTVRGFVFNAMLGHVASVTGADAAKELELRVLRKRRSDWLSHPAPDFFSLLLACTQALQKPDADVAVRELGYASAAAFFASPMGRTLLGIVGRGDPTRLMANEPTAFGTSFSFGKRSYKRLGERQLELTHSEDFLPFPFNVGALDAAMHAVGATAERVVAIPQSLTACRYLISW